MFNTNTVLWSLKVTPIWELGGAHWLCVGENKKTLSQSAIFKITIITSRFRGATVARKPNTLEVARSTLAGIIFAIFCIERSSSPGRTRLTSLAFYVMDSPSAEDIARLAADLSSVQELVWISLSLLTASQD